MTVESAAADARGVLARRALASVGAALALVALAALAASHTLALGPMFAAKAVAFFAVVSVLVLAHLPANHPFAQFGMANQITLLRAGLTALAAGLIGEGSAPTIAAFAAAAGGIAVGLDFVDGRIARARGLASAFGARFDMETDAALVLVLAVLVWQTGKAGWWVMLAGALRYMFVAAGWLWRWMRRPLPPRKRRQTAAAVQMIALAVALAPGVEPPVSTALCALALGLLCHSFAADTLWLYRHSNEDGQ